MSSHSEPSDERGAECCSDPMRVEQDWRISEIYCGAVVKFLTEHWNPAHGGVPEGFEANEMDFLFTPAPVPSNGRVCKGARARLQKAYRLPANLRR